jgi:hypothetical protein
MRVGRVLGILVLAYGLVCVIAGFSKLPLLGDLSNVQVFVNSLGVAGTQVFVVVWGLLVVGLGIWLAFIKPSKPCGRRWGRLVLGGEMF